MFEGGLSTRGMRVRITSVEAKTKAAENRNSCNTTQLSPRITSPQEKLDNEARRRCKSAVDGDGDAGGQYVDVDNTSTCLPLALLFEQGRARVLQWQPKKLGFG